MALEIQVAGREKIPVFENLFQLYIHDFSEQWQGTSRAELGEDGRFERYPYLESYWSEVGRVPLLFRVDGHVAGFALVNRHSHSGATVDCNMAEFFVARKHRRAGIGRRAAAMIFDRLPGIWEVAVARKNVSALAFWRRTIFAHRSVRAIEEIDRNDFSWNGPIFRFSVAAPLASS
jgi:predicted acetyltransferase